MLFLMMPAAKSQTELNPVCSGEKNLHYGVKDFEGAILYKWFIEGGEFAELETNGLGYATTPKTDVLVNWHEGAENYSLKAVGINDFNCESDTAYAVVNVKPSPKLDLGATYQEICENEIATLDAGDLDADKITDYHWQDESGSRYYNATTSGTYQVWVTGENGCQSTDSVVLTVHGLPDVDLGPDFRLRTVDTTLDAGDYSAFKWNTGDITQTVTIDQKSPDTIRVKVTDEHGCVNYDSVKVAKYNDLIKVPSVITPTLVDGKNDTWVLEGLMFYPDATIVVYDRWGNKVFEARGNEYEPWNGTYNGKYLPMDSYHYVIDLKEEGLPKLTGSVTIVR